MPLQISKGNEQLSEYIKNNEENGFMNFNLRRKENC